MNAEHNERQLQKSETARGAEAREQSLRCASCEIEILWPATVVQGRAYCCSGCAAGGPCTCDYSQYLSETISGVIHYLSERPVERK
jgi:hypothetical protein